MNRWGVFPTVYIPSADVLQPERHCRAAVSAERGDECSLLLVFFLDSDLVAPGVAIEEAEQVAVNRGVDGFINLRQPKGSLGQCVLRSV
jgi:hypothetical protein